MGILRKLAWIAAAGAALAPAPAMAESADWYRGGWRTDFGEAHIFEFVIRDEKVTGYHCTQCSDGTTLEPLQGTFDEKEGLSFTLRHLNADGSLASQEQFRAQLSEGELVISGRRGNATIGYLLIKDPRGPTPSPFPINILPPNAPPVPVIARAPGGGGGPPPAPYEQPAPWRQLTADDVAGVWVGFGVGIDKQYFIIRKDGDRLFGLACGRCDNPYTHGALENFRIHGDTVEFDIAHQDWGDGPGIPFERHIVAHIAMNEMRMDARRPDQTGPGIVASLVGPIAIEATAGNVYGE
jgi:hypothetical protein